MDDGTGNVRVVLFRDLAEKIYGAKAEQIEDVEKFYDGLDVLGKEIVVGGRVKKGLSGELELVGNKLEEADAKKECEMVLKEIG